MTKIPVLCFHKISDDFEWRITTYPTTWFKELVYTLVNSGYEFCLPENAKEKKKPIIITFDDAYLSVYENAIPILSDYGIPFILFPVAGYLGKDNTWDVNLGGIRIKHLDEKQISACLKKNGKLGNHSLTHRSYSLLSKTECINETNLSQEIFQDKFGIKPPYFAPPFGVDIDNIECFNDFTYKFILDEKAWDGYNFIIPRFAVYRYESPAMVIKKITSGKGLRTIARVIHWGAKATIMYQKIQGNYNVHTT